MILKISRPQRKSCSLRNRCTKKRKTSKTLLKHETDIRNAERKSLWMAKCKELTTVGTCVDTAHGRLQWDVTVRRCVIPFGCHSEPKANAFSSNDSHHGQSRSQHSKPSGRTTKHVSNDNETSQGIDSSSSRESKRERTLSNQSSFNQAGANRSSESGSTLWK